MNSDGKLKQELQVIAEKLADIEAEMEEYKYTKWVFGIVYLTYSVVIEALKPLDGDRKCHRLVNGVLVERSVSQVLPALTTNIDNVNLLIIWITLIFIIFVTFKLDEKASYKSSFNL